MGRDKREGNITIYCEKILIRKCYCYWYESQGQKLEFPESCASL